MTEEFLKDIEELYPEWRKKEKEAVDRLNQNIKVKLDNWEKIHELLENEDVKDFAERIGYHEEAPCHYLEVHDSLYDFLSRYMSKQDGFKYFLTKDEYPIYCYYKSEEPFTFVKTGKKVGEYADLYWDLQFADYRFGPTYQIRESKRKSFKKENADKIIYLPKEDDIKDAFYRVQAEYVEETFKTNQAHAKKLIMSKYGRKQK